MEEINDALIGLIILKVFNTVCIHRLHFKKTNTAERTAGLLKKKNIHIHMLIFLKFISTDIHQFPTSHPCKLCPIWKKSSHWKIQLFKPLQYHVSLHIN